MKDELSGKRGEGKCKDKTKRIVFVTWNCQGLKTNLLGVKDICENADVVLLQEIWIEEFEGNVLQGIDENFKGKYLSGMNPCRDVGKGRPYGGVAILWRKELVEKVISVKCIDNRRIINVEVMINSEIFNIMSVYAPTDGKKTDDNLKILEFWGLLSAEIENVKHGNVIIGGDFNTDFKREGFFP